MNEIRYETLMEDVDWKLPTVFLAGPTVRGNQPHLTSWRFAAIDLFKEMKFNGNLIIPEFHSKSESDKYRYDIPVWEFTGLQKCDVIMFWISRTRELIGLTTNHEHGYWLGRDRDKVVYGRPDDAYRMTYLDIMWVETGKLMVFPAPAFSIHNTLEKTVQATLLKLQTKTKKLHETTQ